MTHIYLAGAIDRAKEDPLKWTEEVSEALLSAWKGVYTTDKTFKLIIFSPAKAFQVQGSVDTKNAKKLVEINMAALDRADVVVMRYAPGVETWGTPMEALWANHKRIPVFVWATETITSEVFTKAELMLPPYLTAMAEGGICYLRAESVADAVMEHLVRLSENQSSRPDGAFIMGHEDLGDLLSHLRGGL
jgi:nucleoside 2-deoxyribosyltransferase